MPASRPSPDYTPVPAPEPLDLLVVEDDKALRKLMEVVLRMEDFRVRVTADAEEALALEAAFPGPIRLLVTDVTLPGLSGPDLAARVAARRPETRILYVSGHAEAPVGWGGPARVREAAWLRKPFTGSQLIAAVRLHMAGAEGRGGGAAPGALAPGAQGRNSTNPSSRS